MQLFYFVLIVLLSIQANVLTAQEIFRIEGKAKDFPERQVFISNVLDERENKSAIGKTIFGAFSEERTVNFDGALEENLESFYNNNFPAKPNFKPLVLIVKELWLDEKSGSFQERGWVDVSFLLAKEDSSGLTIVFTYKKHLEEKAIDASIGQSSRLKSLLRDCLVEYSKLVPTNTGKIYTSPVVQNREVPAWFKTLNLGLYSSYQDFMNIQSLPFTGTVVPLTEGKIYLKDEQNKKIKNFYAFYNGRNLYLNRGVYNESENFVLTPVLEIGRYFFFEDIILKPSKFNTGGFMGAMVSVKSAPKCGVLDIHTGEVIGLSEKAMDKLLNNNSSLLEKYNASGKSTSSKRKIIREFNETFEKVN